MAVIYKATNKINGKSYIGFDSSWPNRKLAHIHHAKNITDQSFYFHRALNKHGLENFEWAIIKEEATLEDEVKLIEEHKTFWKNGQGYNLTKGGDGNLGWIVPDEVKSKISKKAKGNKRCVGRVLSEETKEKIRTSLKNKTKAPNSHKTKKKRPPPTETQLNTLRNNALKMKKNGHTEETKKKISKSHKGKILTEEHKKNISLNHATNKETGKFYQSEEYKKKMKESLKGKKRTEEQRQRYKEAALLRWAKTRKEGF